MSASKYFTAWSAPNIRRLMEPYAAPSSIRVSEPFDTQEGRDYLVDREYDRAHPPLPRQYTIGPPPPVLPIRGGGATFIGPERRPGANWRESDFDKAARLGVDIGGLFAGATGLVNRVRQAHNATKLAKFLSPQELFGPIPYQIRLSPELVHGLNQGAARPANTLLPEVITDRLFHLQSSPFLRAKGKTVGELKREMPPGYNIVHAIDHSGQNMEVNAKNMDRIKAGLGTRVSTSSVLRGKKTNLYYDGREDRGSIGYVVGDDAEIAELYAFNAQSGYKKMAGDMVYKAAEHQVDYPTIQYQDDLAKGIGRMGTVNRTPENRVPTYDGTEAYYNNVRLMYNDIPRQLERPFLEYHRQNLSAPRARYDEILVDNPNMASVFVTDRASSDSFRKAVRLAKRQSLPLSYLNQAGEISELDVKSFAKWLRLRDKVMNKYAFGIPAGVVGTAALGGAEANNRKGRFSK